MEKEQFIEALRSDRASQIQRALTSEYKITSAEEVEVLCRIAEIHNQDFQNKVMELALKANKKLVRPILNKLSLNGSESSIRIKALSALLESKGVGSTGDPLGSR